MPREISKDEKIPVAPPLHVIEGRTISKRLGWWAAAVLLESWGRKQVCLYLWQRRGDKWIRKQKFTVHNQEQWELINEAVEPMIPQLP